jgi:hypothetical protein
MSQDSDTPYEPPSVEELETCGDPVKTSPMISIDN